MFNGKSNDLDDVHFVTVTDMDNNDNHDNLSRLLDVIVSQTDT